MLDRKDNSYIVRYKLYDTCENLVINVKYKNEHVAESPYSIKESVYPEDCNCATKDLKNLLQTWECSEISEQLFSDLALFEKVDWNVMRNKVSKHICIRSYFSIKTCFVFTVDDKKIR